MIFWISPWLITKPTFLDITLRRIANGSSDCRDAMIKMAKSDDQSFARNIVQTDSRKSTQFLPGRVNYEKEVLCPAFRKELYIIHWLVLVSMTREFCSAANRRLLAARPSLKNSITEPGSTNNGFHRQSKIELNPF